VAAPARRERKGPAVVPALLGELTRHPLLERTIRGRWSIAVIAFALIGIVTLQLGLLKLNAGVGRSLLRERALERQNATLGVENSKLATGERVRTLAQHLGMAPVPLTALRYLGSAHGAGDLAKAAAALRAPVHRSETTAAASPQSAGTSAGAATTATSEGEAGAAGTAASPASSEAEAGAGATPASSAGSEAPATSATRPEEAGAASGAEAGASESGTPPAGG
jgi:hypothetical protein